LNQEQSDRGLYNKPGKMQVGAKPFYTGSAQQVQHAYVNHQWHEHREYLRSDRFKLSNDLAKNYCIRKYFDDPDPIKDKAEQEEIVRDTPFLPQDYIMDIEEHQRFSEENYPKLKLLYEVKM
jgi:N6-adenosine-specific RNA methylase IME4